MRAKNTSTPGAVRGEGACTAQVENVVQFRGCSIHSRCEITWKEQGRRVDVAKPGRLATAGPWPVMGMLGPAFGHAGCSPSQHAARLLRTDLAGQFWHAVAVCLALHKRTQVLQRRRCRGAHVCVSAGALQLLQQREAARRHDGVLVGWLASCLVQGGRRQCAGRVSWACWA